MKKATFTDATQRGYIEGAAAKELKKQMRMSFLNWTWRMILTDLKFMDSGLLDIFLIDKSIKTCAQFEHMVNSYLEMEYKVQDIDAKPLVYRIGEAQKVFGRLGYDSENNREEPILFVGS